MLIEILRKIIGLVTPDETNSQVNPITNKSFKIENPESFQNWHNQLSPDDKSWVKRVSAEKNHNERSR